MQTKPCAECGKALPNHGRRVTCSMACRSARFSRLRKGKGFPAACHIGRAKARHKQVEATVVGLFGALSPREIKIFNRGVKHGYMRCYGRIARWRNVA